MSVELRPLGVHCNISCQYCYQNPIREAGNVALDYDMDKMKQAIKAEGGPFTLFGGEPLLMPIEDLETLFQWGLDTYGSNTVQTNATLITQAHIDMFKRLNVHVGISVDGPLELNDVRWVSNLENTRKATEQTHNAIAQLCEQGLVPSIIITLHRINGVSSAFERMNAWILELEAMKIKTVRLHVLEVDNPEIGKKYRLSLDEQVACFENFRTLEKEKLTDLRFDIFEEIRTQLLADDIQNGCVWHACDPLTTKAVRGVEGMGQRSNCGRTNKDGIEYVKAATEGYERYIGLYSTPFEANGCAGCRFFLTCKGQCPGTSLEGDWRNRTDSCGLWLALFEKAEVELLAEGKTPISQHPQRPELEHALIEHWKAGRNPALQYLLAQAKTDITAEVEPKAWAFARHSWTSTQAQKIWQPRMIATAKALIKIRRLAVVENIYEGAVETIPIQNYRKACEEIEQLGLTIQETQILVGGHQFIDLDPTDDRLGMSVQTRFGRKTTPTKGAVLESTSAWLAHLMPEKTDPDATIPELHQHWTVNPLWTLFGLDLLPAVDSGAPEAATQEQLLKLGERSGFQEELGWLSEILSWPVEWSVLHGIGQLQTPIMRIIHNIAPTHDKHVVRWAGSLLPLEAAQSHGFAYRQPRRRRITSSTSFLRGLREIDTANMDELSANEH